MFKTEILSETQKLSSKLSIAFEEFLKLKAYRYKSKASILPNRLESVY
jgi:hypothetical protein